MVRMHLDKGDLSIDQLQAKMPERLRRSEVALILLMPSRIVLESNCLMISAHLCLDIASMTKRAFDHCP